MAIKEVFQTPLWAHHRAPLLHGKRDGSLDDIHYKEYFVCPYHDVNETAALSLLCFEELVLLNADERYMVLTDLITILL